MRVRGRWRFWRGRLLRGGRFDRGGLLWLVEGGFYEDGVRGLDIL